MNYERILHCTYITYLSKELIYSFITRFLIYFDNMSGSDEKVTELDWTNEQIIKLIREYKKRPMLWDTKHPLYRLQSSKYEAWGEMADIFECEIVDLKKKFNSVFASHRREKAKVRLGGRSTWVLYNHLSFLPSHIANDDTATAVVKPRKKRKTLEETEDELSCEEYEDQGNQSPIDVLIKEEPEYVEETVPKIQYVRSLSSKPRLMLKRKVANQSDRPLERKVFKRSEIFKKKDECDSFGEYIAMSLRKHDERTQSMIKQAINNILFEQEMKKYNVPAEQYVVISTVDENPLTIGDEGEK